MQDGHLNKCIICSKKDTKKRYAEKIKDKQWLDKKRADGRKAYRLLYSNNNKSNPIANKKWQDKFPEKKIALLKSNKLKKPFINAEKHHWSYNEEHFKDVIWLTKQHHKKAHRFLVYDQERLLYRRYDTNELLDTKERHEGFIKWCIETKED